MTYSFGNDNHVMHDETGAWAGYVVPLKNERGFRLHRGLPDMKGYAIIGSIAEAIPALTAYYQAHVPKWKRGTDTRFNCWYRTSTTFTVYYKWTFYGLLSVERQEPRQWMAYRNGDALEESSGRDAIFKTPDEAKCAADVHMRDGFPNSPTIHDGFSWSPPALVPIHVHDAA
jgi:hypothetical protein